MRKKAFCVQAMKKNYSSYISISCLQMPENKRQLLYYYSVNALSWSAVGLYTVSLSWLVLASTHRASSVGFFHLLANASSLLISPFLGPLLGKSRCTTLLILASATVRSAGLTIPLLLEVLNAGTGNSLVFLVAILFGPSNSVFGAASEGMMLRKWPPIQRSSIARRVGLIRQIALSIGFSSAGFLVAEFGSQVTSAVAAFAGMTSALICLRFEDKKLKFTQNSAPYKRSYLLQLTEGIKIIGAIPMLLLPCVVATLGFSVSQMSNALLAPMVTAQQKSAEEFGLITGAWAVGNNISAARQCDLPEIQPACSLVFPITVPGRVVHRFFAYAMDSCTDRNLRGNGRHILLFENSVRDTNRAIHSIGKNSQSATHAFEPHQLHGAICIFDPLAIEKPGARIDLLDMGRHDHQRKLRYAALLEVLRQRGWVRPGRDLRRAPLRRGVEEFCLA